MKTYPKAEMTETDFDQNEVFQLYYAKLGKTLKSFSGASVGSYGWKESERDEKGGPLVLGFGF